MSTHVIVASAPTMKVESDRPLSPNPMYWFTLQRYKYKNKKIDEVH